LIFTVKEEQLNRQVFLQRLLGEFLQLNRQVFLQRLLGEFLQLNRQVSLQRLLGEFLHNIRLAEQEMNLHLTVSPTSQ
jgi:hypothetical protein